MGVLARFRRSVGAAMDKARAWAPRRRAAAPAAAPAVVANGPAMVRFVLDRKGNPVPVRNRGFLRFFRSLRRADRKRRTFSQRWLAKRAKRLDRIGAGLITGGLSGSAYCRRQARRVLVVAACR